MTNSNPHLCPFCGRDCSAIGKPPCAHFFCAQVGMVIRHTEFSAQMEAFCEAKQHSLFSQLLRSNERILRLLRARCDENETCYFTHETQLLEQAFREAVEL